MLRQGLKSSQAAGSPGNTVDTPGCACGLPGLRGFIDRNPQTFVLNIFEASAEDFVRVTHRIHRSAEQASSVEVRVLPAADAAVD
jgi:hypothetical protein